MELVNYINFNENSRGQAIYSSQLYGTYFAIYALIKSQQVTKELKNPESGNTEVIKGYNLESMGLKIVNYKGVINLGITKAELLPVFITDSTEGVEKKIQVGLKLNIEVQGLHGDMDNFFKVDFPKKIDTIHQGTNIETSRFLRPMHLAKSIGSKFPSPETGKQLMNGVYDEEFYYREGKIDSNFTKHIKDKYVARTWDQRDEPVDKSGWMCPFSSSMIL